MASLSYKHTNNYHVKSNNLILTINEPVDYMARAVMILMRGKDIKRAIGRVGLKVEPVLGPEIAQATGSAIWAQNLNLTVS